MSRHKDRNGYEQLDGLIADTSFEIVAFNPSHLNFAKSAYLKYGRGSGHPAKLNIGDCFSYALAKHKNAPLLFKGDDFVHTDIELALVS